MTADRPVHRGAGDREQSGKLEVVAVAGVEGHLPVPGSLVVLRDGVQPWRTEGVCAASATLVGLDGSWVWMPRAALAPDPLQ